MSVTLGAPGNYKPFTRIIDDFAFPFPDKGCGSVLVSDIYELPVLDGKSFCRAGTSRRPKRL
ncbi:MAG: hypothetical protein MJY43_00480 [Bacteroidales bacterium]|nr:hypothetical protein [Bacteroidales bacterium]